LSVVRWKSPQTAAANGRGTIKIEIDVTRACDFHTLDAVDLADPRNQFFCERPGRLLQLTRELERNRRRELAELDFRCLVQNDFRRLDVPLRPNGRAKGVFKACVKVQ